MNGSGTNEFTLSEGSSISDVNASLNETETTVTVSWSGGGQIKPGMLIGRRMASTQADKHMQTQKSGALSP